MSYRPVGYEKKSRMRLITLNLQIPYIEALDKLVEEKKFPNRSEAIRMAVRDLIKTEVWEAKSEV